LANASSPDNCNLNNSAFLSGYQLKVTESIIPLALFSVELSQGFPGIEIESSTADIIACICGCVFESERTPASSSQMKTPLILFFWHILLSGYLFVHLHKK
jgi:hypothetical protein